jgi:hypothetical protein
MPFDLDCNDSDFRAHLSEEQLARLERRECPSRRAAQPPTALAAAVDRLSSGAGDDATTPAEAGLEPETNEPPHKPSPPAAPYHAPSRS